MGAGPPGSQQTHFLPGKALLEIKRSSGKTVRVPQKIKCRATAQPCSPTSRGVRPGTESRAQRPLDSHVHSSTTHSQHGVEAAQAPISGGRIKCLSTQWDLTEP